MKILLFLLLPFSVFSQQQGYVARDNRGKPYFVDTAQTVITEIPSDELRVRFIEAEKLSFVIDNLINRRDIQRDSASWYYYESQIKQAIVQANMIKGKTPAERRLFMDQWNKAKFGVSPGSVNPADIKNVRLYSPGFQK